MSKKRPQDTEYEDDIPRYPPNITLDQGVRPSKRTIRPSKNYSSIVPTKKAPRNTEEDPMEVMEIFGDNDFQNQLGGTGLPLKSTVYKSNKPKTSVVNENDPFRVSTIGKQTAFNPNRSKQNFEQAASSLRVSYRPSQYRPTYKPSVYEKTSVKKSAPNPNLYPQDRELPIHNEKKVPNYNNLFVPINNTYPDLIKPEIYPVHSYMEIPKGTKFFNPILSPSGLYFACIAEDPKEQEDLVYVWEINNLANYKHKFTRLNVASIAFTPDSLSIILVYKDTNPVIYSLKNANKVIDLQPNGEEGERIGLDFGFIMDGRYFGYASAKSFSMWNISTGGLVKYFPQNSPIKKIYNEHILYINSNDGQIKCTIIQFNGEKIYEEFNLKGVSDPSQILDCRLGPPPEYGYLIYVLEEGSIKYDFRTREYKGIHKFKRGSLFAFISEDCEYTAKSDLVSFDIHDVVNQKNIGSIINKDPFDCCGVSFENGKVFMVKNGEYICLHDFVNENKSDEYIWLDECPKKITNVRFSKNGDVFLAKEDENNYFSYNVRSKKIMKKWKSQSNSPLIFGISSGACSKFLMAIKENSNFIQVWDIENNKEVGKFLGFNSSNFYFSNDGKYLLAGTKRGNEVCRLWNLKDGTYKSFNYKEENNIDTFAALSEPKHEFVICCSQNQQPIILEAGSGDLIYKCESRYLYDKVTDIKTNSTDKGVVLIKGEEKGTPVGSLYRLCDGTLIENYENFNLLELSEKRGYLMSTDPKISDNRFCIANLNNLEDAKRKYVSEGCENSKFVYMPNDDEVVASIYQDFNDYNKEYTGQVSVIDPEEGKTLGIYQYKNNTNKPSIADVVYDERKYAIVPKFVVLIGFEESMAVNRRKINVARAKDNSNLEVYGKK